MKRHKKHILNFFQKSIQGEEVNQCVQKGLNKSKRNKNLIWQQKSCTLLFDRSCQRLSSLLLLSLSTFLTDLFLNRKTNFKIQTAVKLK